MPAGCVSWANSITRLSPLQEHCGTLYDNTDTFSFPIRSSTDQMSLLAAGGKKLVLDLKNVTMIASSGLDVLVTAHTSAKSSGATLRLFNLGSRTNKLLQITRLVNVFEVSDSEADALRALANRASGG